MVEAAPDVSDVITTDLPRFGTCSYRESDVILFPWGLPGFGHLRRFLVLALEGQEHFVWLQSLDAPEVALPAADPWAFFPDYAPKLPGYARLSLDLQRPEDFTTLGVVVVKPSGEMTMNLLAPIYINLVSRVARQVPLESGDYGVRVPLPLRADSAGLPAETAAE
jgi:flagellar assembly factor FliW